MESRSVTQAGVQWCNLSSLQTFISPGFKHSPASASWVARTTGACHHTQRIFVFLAETGFTMLARLVSNSWPRVIYLPWPPKVLGLQTSLCLAFKCYLFAMDWIVAITTRKKLYVEALIPMWQYLEMGPLRGIWMTPGWNHHDEISVLIRRNIRELGCLSSSPHPQLPCENTVRRRHL